MMDDEVAKDKSTLSPDFPGCDFGDAVLIVAHPDDEILWFSSVLAKVSRIVVAYTDVPGQPQWTKGRRALRDQYPYPNTDFLDLTEAVSIYGANWQQPKLSPYGLKVRASARTLIGFDAQRYKDNYATLESKLENVIAKAGCVFTHNAWGEYGHEDHVQLSQVVRKLGARHNVPVWYSNYVSDRSVGLMTRLLQSESLVQHTMPTNPDAYQELEKLYLRLGCWTWSDANYAVPATDGFLRYLAPGESADEGRGGSVALNYLNVDGAEQFRIKRSYIRRKTGKLLAAVKSRIGLARR